MYKKALFLATILVIIILVIFFVSNNKKEPEKIDLVTKTLSEAKLLIEMDLNMAPEIISWNENNEVKNYLGLGCSYLDGLNAPKIDDIFNKINSFFSSAGFENNQENTDQNSKKFKKEGIVCNLFKSNNPNNTTTVKFSCASTGRIAYSFSSGRGIDCSSDDECSVITDGCGKTRVCRNLKLYDFYNDCENPSQLIQDIDFSVARCQCVDNKCIQKKSSPNDPGPKIKLNL